jgi:phage gpG-like protein
MTVLGLSETLANLARIAGELEAEEPLALEAGAEVVRDAWVHNIESDGLVLTGRYRDSVTVVGDGESAGVVTDVDYAGILEFGDSRQAAHFVAQRAADEHQDEVMQRVGDRLGQVMR